jgi:hypothetical protein
MTLRSGARAFESAVTRDARVQVSGEMPLTAMTVDNKGTHDGTCIRFPGRYGRPHLPT